jgi:hypothetical protein
MYKDDLARFGIGVARRSSFDGLFELAIETAEQDARLANWLQRVPGRHHVRGCVRAELQVEARNRWRLDRIGRSVRMGLGFCGSDNGRRDHGPHAKACGCKQPATAELDVESIVPRGHGRDTRRWLHRDKVISRS